MQHLKRLGLTKKQMIGLAFVLPVFLWHMCIVMIPAVRTLFMSFYEWNGLSDPTFIGLDNFKKMLFEDRVAHQALLNNVIWMAVFLIVPLGAGLLVAFLSTSYGMDKWYIVPLFFCRMSFPQQSQESSGQIF